MQKTPFDIIALPVSRSEYQEAFIYESFTVTRAFPVADMGPI